MLNFVNCFCVGFRCLCLVAWLHCVVLDLVSVFWYLGLGLILVVGFCCFILSLVLKICALFVLFGCLYLVCYYFDSVYVCRF